VLFRLEPGSCTLRVHTLCRIVVSGSIKRSDYGMNSHSTAVADTVQLGLNITLEPAGS